MFGLLVVSVVAFVELARQFDKILGNHISLDQFAAFVDSPPGYFTIEPLSFDVLKELIHLPTICWINGEKKGIEAMDNIHVATARMREHCRLAATDSRIIAAYRNSDLLVW